MKDTVQLRKKAIEFRKFGYSYSDISKIMSVSKTSVSNWVKNVKLTEIEKIHLIKSLKIKREKGRLKAAMSNRSKKIFKEKVAYENAEKKFEEFLKDPLFIFGLSFYWARGLKKSDRFQFMSSDQIIIKIMLMWMEKYLDISRNMARYRLFIDISCKNQGYEELWWHIVGVSEEFFQKTVYIRSRKDKINKEYRGSLAITFSNTDVFRRFMAWQKIAVRYYS